MNNLKKSGILFIEIDDKKVYVSPTSDENIKIEKQKITYLSYCPT